MPPLPPAATPPPQAKAPALGRTAAESARKGGAALSRTWRTLFDWSLQYLRSGSKNCQAKAVKTQRKASERAATPHMMSTAPCGSMAVAACMCIVRPVKERTRAGAQEWLKKEAAG